MIELDLPYAARPLLAVGGELKNAFCLARDRFAWLSPPNGDMEYIESQARFEASLGEMQARYKITPEAIACDLHPGYHSARWAIAAAETQGVPLVKVQHHHAHVAAVMAEHGLGANRQVIGIALDGTGYGTDGCIWGGEVLVADYRTFTRAAQLKYVPLPGGDSAVRKPYRMALAHLWAAGIPWDDDLPPIKACSDAERRVLLRQLERRLNTVPTSSMGRLFDAVAALIGLRQSVEFEGQAAIELESCATGTTRAPYAFAISGDEWPLQIDPAPLLRALIADLRAGIPLPILSGGFHAAVARALISAAETIRSRTGINSAALSGGVFQNLRLLHSVQGGLEKRGFAVYTHQRLSPNDSSLALGQAAVAHHLLAERLGQ